MLWILYGFISAFFTTTRSIFGKKVLEHEHAMEYGAAQGFVSLLILIFFLPFINLGLSWQIYAFLYIISVAFTAGNLYFLRSIRHTPISTAIPLMNISPLFLVVIAYFFLGEQPDAWALIGVLLLVAGTYILQMGQGRKSLLQPFRKLIKSKYSVFMIMAMLIYSFTATMEKAAIDTPGVSVLTAFVIVRIFVSINYIIAESFEHGPQEIFSDLKKDGKFIIGGSISSLLAIFFAYLALGVPGAMVSLVIPIRRLSTLMATLYGGKMFHEHRLGWKMFACAVMLAGVILIAL